MTRQEQVMIAPEERTERFGLPLVCVATDKI